MNVFSLNLWLFYEQEEGDILISDVHNFQTIFKGKEMQLDYRAKPSIAGVKT